MEPAQNYGKKVKFDRMPDCSGMTLVEIMIALSLLTIVAVGIMGSFTMLFSTSRAASASTEVQITTERVIQELNAVPFEQLLAWDGSSVEEDGITVGITVSQVSPTVLQIETAGVKPGREGGHYLLVTLRADR